MPTAYHHPRHERPARYPPPPPPRHQLTIRVWGISFGSGINPYSGPFTTLQLTCYHLPTRCCTRFAGPPCSAAYAFATGCLPSTTTFHLPGLQDLLPAGSTSIPPTYPPRSSCTCPPPMTSTMPSCLPLPGQFLVNSAVAVGFAMGPSLLNIAVPLAPVCDSNDSGLRSLDAPARLRPLPRLLLPPSISITSYRYLRVSIRVVP